MYIRSSMAEVMYSGLGEDAWEVSNDEGSKWDSTS